MRTRSALVPACVQLCFQTENILTEILGNGLDDRPETSAVFLFAVSHALADEDTPGGRG